MEFTTRFYFSFRIFLSYFHTLTSPQLYIWVIDRVNVTPIDGMMKIALSTLFAGPFVFECWGTLSENVVLDLYEIRLPGPPFWVGGPK